MIARLQIAGSSTAYELVSIAMVGFIVLAALGCLALASIVVFGQLSETSRRLRARDKAARSGAPDRTRRR